MPVIFVGCFVLLGHNLALKSQTLVGVVAQLVERLVRNEKVRGSNPLGSTSLRSEQRGERRLPRQSAAEAGHSSARMYKMLRATTRQTIWLLTRGLLLYNLKPLEH
jgi:hypothetical protein